MSSAEVNLLTASVKQYHYKLKAYTGLVNRLIIAQMLALVFSYVGATGMMSSGNDELTVTVSTYSASMVIVFSIFWIITIAITLTTKQYKKIELPLVGTRISGNLSDVGFLLTASVYAGMTSSLFGVLLRIIMYFTSDSSKIVFDEFSLAFPDLLLGMVVAILYMALISAMAYCTGVLAQVNMAFVIIIPVLIFGSLKVYTNFMQSVFKFYVGETFLPLFALKILFTSLILFGISLLLSNRMEVNR
ncbi:Permeases of the major facilitator superfamily [Desulfosporosinus sp. I2]|uniref:hypothetical protein n=1 Tax=Desulfosporosinus sp. I2 TaxID=1617025 RepID=UPI0005F04CE6|nr:hypothetical protein [Desulfosporosinus sp. I2]KJR48731.1 Permeases of the major facilitator superfamily [Desulfosporosinus sp. I2]